MCDISDKLNQFDKKLISFREDLKEKTRKYLGACEFNKNILDTLSTHDLFYLINENFGKSADLFFYSSNINDYEELLLHHKDAFHQYKNKFLVSTFLCESKIHLPSKEIEILFEKCSDEAKNSSQSFLIIGEICEILGLTKI